MYFQYVVVYFYMVFDKAEYKANKDLGHYNFMILYILSVCYNGGYTILPDHHLGHLPIFISKI